MVEIIFVEARYNKYINFKNLIEFLKEKFLKNSKEEVKKRLALFSSVQFLSNVESLEKELKEYFIIMKTKPKRAFYNFQILGCDSYGDSLNLDIDKIDFFVVVNDGLFHPLALLYAQENSVLELENKEEKNKNNAFKEIIVFNPITERINIIDKDIIKKNIMRRKANLKKFYISKNIGVYITTKTGQSMLYAINNIKKKLKKKFPEKRFYFFLGDNFYFNETENYPYIDCWVNTACPRIGQDDILNNKISLINIKDILYKND